MYEDIFSSPFCGFLAYITSMLSPLLCYGEISWDIATQVDHLPNGESDSQALYQTEGPGGCAFNTAAALSALRCPVYLSGNQMGHDSSGTKLLHALNNYDMIQTYDLVPSLNHTPQCQIYIEASSGQRSFVLLHQNIQIENHVAIEKTKRLLSSGQVQYAFLQCYLRSSIKNILNGLNTKTILMTQDLSPHDELILAFDLHQLSLPKPTCQINIDDCVAYTAPYFKNGAKQIFLTCGPFGVFYCSTQAFPGSQTKRLDQYEHLYYFYQEQKNHVQALDTTGCGDAFRAGLLFYLNQNKSIQESILFGQTLGANKACVQGSCLPFDFTLPSR